MNKYYYIYTAKMVDNLIEKGFKCLGSKPDFKNPNFQVYLFKNTPELRDAVWNFCQENK